MIVYMQRESFDNLSTKTIIKLVAEAKSDSRYDNLKKYYIGKHKILEHTKRDLSVPNNKIINNVAKYITDTATGYFIGKPVAYSCVDDKQMEVIQDIFDYNDEQDLNTEIAKSISIYGHTFEMLYIDEDANVRFTKVEAKNIIAIYSSSGTLLGVIRIINPSKYDEIKNTKIEFFTTSTISTYMIENEHLKLLEEVEHYFGDIPFVEYINNEERLGDFEGVISIIDAYNKVQSNTANLFEYNDEAILKISKMGDVSIKDIREMADKKAVILDDGGDISWVIKDINDIALENYKKRLRDDIHIFSNIPNLTDDAFGGNLSGVAVSYKLWALEQICSIKERKFKKALQRRLELIVNILNLKGASYSYMDIETYFRRNKPQNILETAQIVTMLNGELSRETRLKMLPNIEDVKLELEKLEKEKETMKGDFGMTGDFLKSLGAVNE